jgi:hypothetical protein
VRCIRENKTRHILSIESMSTITASNDVCFLLLPGRVVPF